MTFHGRSLLLGAGLFGMAIGAALGLVAGDMARDCAATFHATGETGVVPLCESAFSLRLAAFGLVGLSALAAALPFGADALAMLRARRRADS